MNKQFKIKKEHSLLIKNMCVSWDDAEFGAPCIDPKRPYGNSNVYQDMIEILGLKKIKNGIYELKLDGKKYLLKGEDKYKIDLDDEFELTEILEKLHKETEIALQFCLINSSIKTGIIETDEYSRDWKKVK